MITARAIQDGGVFSILGHVLFGYKPVKTGDTELFLDGNQVDSQSVNGSDGSYHYTLIARAGKHLCAVRYNGSQGEAESIWVDFEVKKSTATIVADFTAAPDTVGLDIGDETIMTCKITVTDTDPSNPLLPYGYATLYEIHDLDGAKVELANLKVDDKGECHYAHHVRKNSYSYYWEYRDHRGHATSPTITIHPVVAQTLYMGIETTRPPGTAVVAGEMVLATASVYTMDYDLPADSLERTVVTAGTVVVSMDGADILTVIDINDLINKTWELPITVPLGTHTFSVKFTGTEGTIETDAGDFTGQSANRTITIEVVPPTNQIVGDRHFVATGKATHADGTPVTDGEIDLHRTGHLLTMSNSLSIGTSPIAPDGQWTVSAVALTGDQTIQAVLINSASGVGASPTISFTALDISADTIWRTAPEYLTWRNFPEDLTWASFNVASPSWEDMPTDQIWDSNASIPAWDDM